MIQSKALKAGKSLRYRSHRLWNEYLMWPMPLWRMQRSAKLYLGGYELRLHLSHDHFLWAWRVQRGYWENAVIQFLTNAVHPGDIFLDIGAWIGPYALLASRLVQPGGRVYSFEPDPRARAQLERNLKANHVSNVTVLPYGVTDREGSAWLDRPRLGGSETQITLEASDIEVQTVTLRNFCQKHRIYPSVIKIDVEGAESKVLDGGIEEMRNARAVVLEVHEEKLRNEGVDPSAFLQSLCTLGKRKLILDSKPSAHTMHLALTD